MSFYCFSSVLLFPSRCANNLFPSPLLMLYILLIFTGTFFSCWHYSSYHVCFMYFYLLGSFKLSLAVRIFSFQMCSCYCLAKLHLQNTKENSLILNSTKCGPCHSYLSSIPFSYPVFLCFFHTQSASISLSLFFFFPPPLSQLDRRRHTEPDLRLM